MPVRQKNNQLLLQPRKRRRRRGANAIPCAARMRGILNRCKYQTAVLHKSFEPPRKRRSRTPSGIDIFWRRDFPLNWCAKRHRLAPLAREHTRRAKHGEQGVGTLNGSGRPPTRVTTGMHPHPRDIRLGRLV